MYGSLNMEYNEPTIKNITIHIAPLTIPVQEIEGIIQNNWSYQNGEVIGFNKINAIKELREHFRVTTNRLYYMPLSNKCLIGLREAKEIIEAVYLDGVERGIWEPIPYKISPNQSQKLVREGQGNDKDTLPF